MKVKQILLGALVTTLLVTNINAQENVEGKEKKFTIPRGRPNSIKDLAEEGVLEILKNTTVNIVGTTENGLVLETESGEKLVQLRVGRKPPPPWIIKTPPQLIWTPIIPKPRVSKLVLLGASDKGLPVWAGPDGKGGCTLDEKGSAVSYVGHVTLLK
jgi:hypothetical protein